MISEPENGPRPYGGSSSDTRPTGAADDLSIAPLVLAFVVWQPRQQYAGIRSGDLRRPDSAPTLSTPTPERTIGFSERNHHGIGPNG